MVRLLHPVKSPLPRSKGAGQWLWHPGAAGNILCQDVAPCYKGPKEP